MQFTVIALKFPLTISASNSFFHPPLYQQSAIDYTQIIYLVAAAWSSHLTIQIFDAKSFARPSRMRKMGKSVQWIGISVRSGIRFWLGWLSSSFLRISNLWAFPLSIFSTIMNAITLLVYPNPFPPFGLTPEVMMSLSYIINKYFKPHTYTTLYLPFIF